MKKFLTIAAATAVLGAGVYAEPAKAEIYFNGISLTELKNRSTNQTIINGNNNVVNQTNVHQTHVRKSREDRTYTRYEHN